jgi:hypothetical protein
MTDTPTQKGGSWYQRNLGWSTNPQYVYEAAKERAKACINDPAPKLTTLERAFYDALKGKRG